MSLCRLLGCRCAVGFVPTVGVTKDGQSRCGWCQLTRACMLESALPLALASWHAVSPVGRPTGFCTDFHVVKERLVHCMYQFYKVFERFLHHC